MNLSFGEFGALVAKAFRGAGYSWGLTEDASFAAQRLAEFDASAGDAVVRLLHTTSGIDTTTLMPNAEWASVGDLLCPVCVGATMIDSGQCPEVVFDGLVEPALLTPFLARLAEGSHGYSLEWTDGSCEVTAEATAFTGELPRAATSVRLSARADAPLGTIVRLTRVELDEATSSTLASFAQRTYAPATEESRLTGAGAGILDED